MPSDTNFEDNHKALVDKGVVPSDHDPQHLPDWAKTAIENLKPNEINALGDIAKSSNSHVYLHNDNDGRYTILAV